MEEEGGHRQGTSTSTTEIRSEKYRRLLALYKQRQAERLAKSTTPTTPTTSTTTTSTSAQTDPKDLYEPLKVTKSQAPIPVAVIKPTQRTTIRLPTIGRGRGWLLLAARLQRPSN